MKVLFAVNNESISEAIIKKYQQEYKEIISSKNVYYFDAITRELQKDKTYDRIVISEDVEPFANNNYGVIDKFIFERLDSIKDEATGNMGNNIPIILICADRRNKSEDFLVKIFGIGIYNALIGQDRTISKLCALIDKPRDKKEARAYYRIDVDDAGYDNEGEGNVNEIEIQNILNHYKRLGKNEEEYVKSFDNIAEQYTDAQLKVICKFLPINVKAVLEANSPKYQELITFGEVTPNISQGKKEKKNKYIPNKDYEDRKKAKQIVPNSMELFEKNMQKNKLNKPVVIPSVATEVKSQEIVQSTPNINVQMQNTQKQSQQMKETNKELNQSEIEDLLQSVETDINISEEPVKKKRGRPKKIKEEVREEQEPKRKRGRPKKVAAPEEIEKEQPEDVNLFELGTESSNKVDGGIILPGISNESEAVQQNELNLFDLGSSNNYTEPTYTNNQYSEESKEIQNTRQYDKYKDTELKNLISMSNKLVAFVGTSKNGTSFLVNSVAEILSKKGIKTAILDLTQNKNAYYIYTQNDEELRKVAFSCITNLQNGIADGIEVNKNLTVYTTLPDRSKELEDYKNILTTLTKHYSLVIMDCDYETNYAYFNLAQELYLVQSFDILTIQPLTEFLRNLKSRDILEPEKLRIVLNKVLRVRSISERVIIGGMSSYNDPSMSYMTELFDKDHVQSCIIPFDQEAYSRYLDGLVNCEISTKGYPKNLMASLEKLGNMIYPLLNNDKPANKFNTYNSGTSNFSNDINETLNKMKNRY